MYNTKCNFYCTCFLGLWVLLNNYNDCVNNGFLVLKATLKIANREVGNQTITWRVKEHRFLHPLSWLLQEEERKQIHVSTFKTTTWRGKKTDSCIQIHDYYMKGKEHRFLYPHLWQLHEEKKENRFLYPHSWLLYMMGKGQINKMT